MSESRQQLVFRQRTGNSQVEIIDYNGSRSLYFGGRYLQSRMALRAPHHLLLPYTRCMMFSLLLASQLERILLIGLGAGSLARFLHHHFPGCVIDAVEHSPLVIKLARGYFQLPDDPRLRIHCQDGGEFLDGCDKTTLYDLILLDAFDEHGMAARLYNGSFFQRCAESLHPAGIFSANCWSGGGQALTAIRAELSSIYCWRLQLPVPERGNVILLGGQQPLTWQDLTREKKEMAELEHRFALDFSAMVRLVMRHNFTLVQRLLFLLSPANRQKRLPS